MPTRPEDYASVTLPRDRGSGPATSPSRDGKDLPSAKHVTKFEEKIVRKGFSEDVRFLLSRSAVCNLNSAIFNIRTKVMIFESNVLRARAKLACGRHRYA